jgi:hypothetical protein
MKNESQILQAGIFGYKNRDKNPFDKVSAEHFVWEKGYYCAMGAADRQLGRSYHYFDDVEKYLMYDMGWTNPKNYGY